MRTVRIRLSFIMDRRVSQRQPLALLAGRCGPVTTEKETLAEHFESRRVIAGTTVRRKA